MSYTRSSLAVAEREASDLNVAASLRRGSPSRYRAQRYPNGTDDVASWKWGVGEYQAGYHKDGTERFVGFVWKAGWP
jgi:hypothetical protein